MPNSEIPEPIPGSLWRHHSGRHYIVLFLTNEPNTDKEKYPRTVIYMGPNNKLWSGRLDDWNRRMTEVKIGDYNVVDPNPGAPKMKLNKWDQTNLNILIDIEDRISSIYPYPDDATTDFPELPFALGVILMTARKAIAKMDIESQKK